MEADMPTGSTADLSNFAAVMVCFSPITIRTVGTREGEHGLELAQASKYNRDPQFLRDLFDLGRKRATDFYGGGSTRGEFMARLSPASVS